MNALTRLKAVLAQDRAENSIMQTISIAVSAILIAAGLITAPSLINNARDVNTKSDVANISYAQEYAYANSGGYAATLAALKTATGPNATEGTNGVKYTLSTGTSFGMVLDDKAGYIVLAKSPSKKWFLSIGTSTKVVQVGNGATDTAPTVVQLNAALATLGVAGTDFVAQTAVIPVTATT